MNMMLDWDFFKEKKVLVTGHTGFKGTWMCRVLLELGSQVVGYALKPLETAVLYDLSGVEKRMHSIIGDIRDFGRLKRVFEEERPEIVFHLAAQPIVRESYEEPLYTYDVNVMGTANVLECIRLSDSVRSFVNVTTDKVYLNREWEWGYRENEELDGYDPYSNSKSCSELVTRSYKRSFFADDRVAISTVRAGNVIGGGDFSRDRIIPDCVRAAFRGEPILLRNPYSIRPYQHVLESVYAYLMIAQEQYKNPSLAGSYNVGPDEMDCKKTEEIVTLFCEKWSMLTGKSISWESQSTGGPHEANYLRLDCSKLKHTFGWRPTWDIETAIEKTVEWYKVYSEQEDILACMREQIRAFL